MLLDNGFDINYALNNKKIFVSIIEKSYYQLVEILIKLNINIFLDKTILKIELTKEKPNYKLIELLIDYSVGCYADTCSTYEEKTILLIELKKQKPNYRIINLLSEWFATNKYPNNIIIYYNQIKSTII